MRQIRSSSPAALVALSLLAGCAAPPPEGEVSPRVLVLESDPLHIDRLYTSMEGPQDRVAIDASELDWVTAFRAEVVSAADGKPLGDEFFCHAQLQLQNTTRLMVAATGTDEVRFPPGFAMPVSQIVSGLDPSQRETTLFGMVLNNFEPRIDRWVRVRWSVEYFRDEEAGSPPRFKRLYKVGLPMTVEDLEAYAPPPGVEPEDETARCVLVGGLNAHWLVPPGEQVTRRRFSDFLAVDATVHYAVVHLHAHARSMRLTDVTTGEVLWQTEVRYSPERVEIEEIPVYSSVEGFPVYRDHTYEIEARYVNPTPHDVDAMAVMDLFYHPVHDEWITYPVGPVDDLPAHL